MKETLIHYSIKMKGGNQKLSEFVGSRPALQEMLTSVFQAEMTEC